MKNEKFSDKELSNVAMHYMNDGEFHGKLKFEYEDRDPEGLLFEFVKRISAQRCIAQGGSDILLYDEESGLFSAVKSSSNTFSHDTTIMFLKLLPADEDFATPRWQPAKFNASDTPIFDDDDLTDHDARYGYITVEVESTDMLASIIETIPNVEIGCVKPLKSGRRVRPVTFDFGIALNGEQAVKAKERLQQLIDEPNDKDMIAVDIAKHIAEARRELQQDDAATC